MAAGNNMRVQIDTAVKVLRKGGVVALPTDTIYGLSASATEIKAIQRVYKIKGRSEINALPLLLASFDDFEKYASEIPECAWNLITRFMPGPFTIVLKKANTVADIVSGGRDTVALRIPNHTVPRTVVRELGAAITGTSANRSGSGNLTTSNSVKISLGNNVDLVIDGQSSLTGLASTIVDVTGPSPIIIRQGAISSEVIENTCKEHLAVKKAETGI